MTNGRRNTGDKQNNTLGSLERELEASAGADFRKRAAKETKGSGGSTERRARTAVTAIISGN